MAGGPTMETRGERLARGDQSAFAELYDACADRVHHYLVVFLGARADADDALQETFCRLARNRAKLAGIENLVAYVFTVARNEALRIAGRQSREATRLDTTVSPEELFCDAAGKDERAREMAEWVAATLARLEPELRELVELKTYGDLTIREIGEVTGVPQGTVATRYRKALETLRALMAKEGQ